RFQFGQNRAHKPAGIEQIPASHAICREENADQLVTDSFRADLIDRRRVSYKRAPSSFINLVIKDRGKPYGTQHPQPILLETLHWVANCAHQFCADVGPAANKINDLVCDRLIKHSVNREVASLCVFLRRREMHRAGVSAVDVRVIGTERGYLELKT